MRVDMSGPWRRPRRLAVAWLVVVGTASSFPLTVVSATAVAANNPPARATSCPGRPHQPPAVGTNCGGAASPLAPNVPSVSSLPRGAAACPSVSGKQPSSATASCTAAPAYRDSTSPILALPGGSSHCPSVAGKASSPEAACASDQTIAQPAVHSGPISLPPGMTRCPDLGSKQSSATAACGSNRLAESATPSQMTVTLPSGSQPCVSTSSKQSSPTAACVSVAAVGGMSVRRMSTAGIAPANIAGYSVSLYESSNALPPGYSTTLSAYANLDVGPTPYYLEIYDRSTGGRLAVCGSGSSCSTSISESSPTTHSFIAYIGSYSGTNPPGTIAATSGIVSCTWLSISMGASPQYLAPGGRSTVTAYVNTDVGPTPYYIEVFDASTGANLAICASGSACSGSEAQSGATVHTFVAYVSGYGTSNPPPSRQVSASINVVWFGISLAASQVTLVTGGTTTLTASANADVGPSPYWISIFDLATGRVTLCGTGSSCSVNVTQPTSTIRDYVAYVGSSSTGNPPAPVAATSSLVQVTWLTVSLAANPTLLAPAAISTLTATTTQDVGSTPYYIEIFDHSTHTLLASCATGTSCSTSVSQSGAAVRNFIAYVSAYGTGDPPSNARTTSNVVPVTWWGVSLSTSSSLVGPGATVTLTATANFNVSGTPYWVEIFDQSSSPNFLNACGNGSGTSTICTATQSHVVGGEGQPHNGNAPSSITDSFVAYLTSQFSTSYQPSGILVTSNVVNTKWAITLSNHGGSDISPPVVYVTFVGSEWQTGFTDSGGFTNTQAMNYVTDFFTGIGGSAYLGALGQYGVSNPSIQLGGTPWILPAAVPSAGWQAHQSGAQWAAAAYNRFLQPGFPDVSFGAVYVLITAPNFPQPSDVASCSAFHDLSLQPNEDLSFAYLPYTPNNPNCEHNLLNETTDSFGHGWFDSFSTLLSHEYTEALTDANLVFGWWQDSLPNSTEVADACGPSQIPDQVVIWGSWWFVVQGIWSNSSHSCVIPGGSNSPP